LHKSEKLTISNFGFWILDFGLRYLGLLQEVYSSSFIEHLPSPNRWLRPMVREGLAERSSQVLVSQEDLGARYALAEQMFPSGRGGDSEIFAAML
jgi:hypothetical protein